MALKTDSKTSGHAAKRLKAGEDVRRANKSESIETDVRFISRAPAKKAKTFDTRKDFESPDEVQHIRSTFRSGLFKLQTTELLKEVTVSYDRTKEVQSLLHSLKSMLEDIPEEVVVPHPPSSNRFFKSFGVINPQKLAFKFKKPTSVDVAGSFQLQLLAKPELNVNVTVIMPKKCFLGKDFLNHRYHMKRLLYLLTLESFLTKSGMFERVAWDCFRGDFQKPILTLHPHAVEGASESNSFVIKILPAIASETFDIAKLSFTRNNVREAKTKDGAALATPHYNSSILEDIQFKQHAVWLHSHEQQIPHFKDAVLLLKVWARQRGFTSAADTFNGFLLSVIAAHLSTAAGGESLTSHMTSYQIFRVVMENLARDGFLSKGIFLQQENGKPNCLLPQSKQTMLKAFDMVVCDPLGRLNLASRITASAVKEVKLAAAITLASLKMENIDCFDAVFMTKVDYAAAFDYHVRISLGSTTPSEAEKVRRHLDEDAYRREESNVEKLLTRGLGPRATLVRAVRRYPSNALEQVSDGFIYVGINLAEPEVAFRLADVGPSAENKEEASKFRAFWGPKSELRRFKDALIAETAVWDCPMHERHLIIEKIVKFVCHRHLGLSAEDVLVTAGQLDFSLQENGADPVKDLPKAQEAFDKLSKALRELKDVPLGVVGVQAVSPVLWQTAVFPPAPHPLAMADANLNLPKSAKVAACVDPIEIAIQLEGSGKWPDDPVAIQKTKIAFCLKIGECLEAQHGAHMIASEECVDILLHGFVFRMHILYEKDATFLKSSSPGGEKGAPAGTAQKQIPSSLEADLALRASHGSLMLSLQGMHPLFAPTARLAKRWVAAHMFLSSSALCEEAVELLVAAVFSPALPFAAPRSRITAFLRFLRLLGSTDWANSALVVDVNGDLSSEDQQHIQAVFDKSRDNESTPSSPMFIATAYDKECQTWTKHSPSPEVLKRIVAFAKSSSDLLTKLINNTEANKWKSLFCTPLSVHDVVLGLSRSCLPHPRRTLFESRQFLQHVEGDEKKSVHPLSVLSSNSLASGAESARDALLIGFDPRPILLKQLQARFGHLAEFCFDVYGGDAVGVRWVLPKRSLNIRDILMYPVKRTEKPTKSSSMYEANLDCILDDVLSLGEPIVENFQVNKLPTWLISANT